MKGIIFYGWVENINLAIFKHKIESQRSLGFSLKMFLEFHKFQPQYSYKIKLL